jgi:hypothetical protein
MPGQACGIGLKMKGFPAGVCVGVRGSHTVRRAPCGRLRLRLWRAKANRRGQLYALCRADVRTSTRQQNLQCWQQ